MRALGMIKILAFSPTAILVALLPSLTYTQESGPFSFDLSRINSHSESDNSSSLIWQPLQSSFRPLNRFPPSLPTPPTPPIPPTPPRPPTPPSLPESLALIRGDFDQPVAESRGSRIESFNRPRAIFIPTSTGTPPPTFTTISGRFDLDEEQPTRMPMIRFRPTRAPSDDRESSLRLSVSTTPDPSTLTTNTARTDNSNSNSSSISNECFECICEASTNCNAQSRCQTSDVRHTKCGLFLISYDQWIASGLSRRLVSSEALSRDVAADERAYYECVTNRECAEELIHLYMQSNARDCDRDGRIDCYDIAAIHQGGVDQCNSETLLESQYWSDFNACYGFAR